MEPTAVGDPPACWSARALTASVQKDDEGLTVGAGERRPSRTGTTASPPGHAGAGHPGGRDGTGRRGEKLSLLTTLPATDSVRDAGRRAEGYLDSLLHSRVWVRIPVSPTIRGRNPVTPGGRPHPRADRAGAYGPPAGGAHSRGRSSAVERCPSLATKLARAQVTLDVGRTAKGYRSQVRILASSSGEHPCPHT
jgi:hypothetical protein